MIHLDTQDTIAAIASPAGPGLRGIVRLSGPIAWPLALEGFVPDSVDGFPPDRPEIRAGQRTVDGLRTPLPGLLALWPGPRTYTGQPLAEIHTVGSPPLLQQVLADCLARGARLAEPGEFTLRAFLAGRIDLTRAEAVLGVIEARSPAQLDSALKQLAGGLAGPIERLRDRVLDVLAHLEAGLDFVEEPDVDPIGRQRLADELGAAAENLAELAGQLQSRDRPERAPRFVLVGPPNAGKSRLFNALLGAEHAIVSPIAGTTRDYLSAACDCDGLEINLIDTAGIEPSAGPIEAQAQAFQAAQAAGADLLLDCRSADTPELVEIASERPRLLVWTKCDANPEPLTTGAIPTSAETGAGLDRLRTAIADSLRLRSEEGDAPALTGARCRDGLAQAATALRSASQAIELGAGDELVAIDLRAVVEELGKVVGAVVTDDILDRIFSRFCIGK
ncbi:tRNA uridine-5-carboxymethylaminomethyl(34) synthesis GTPase MnmE [soil metagenome]